VVELAGCVVTPAGPVPGALVCEDGRVAALRADAGAPADRLLLPGFVDLHVHGGGGADVMDGPDGVLRVAAFHLRRGTTALCPTTVTRPLDELREFLTGVAALPEGGRGARVLGAHLEGPFIAPAKRGAQPDCCREPDREALEALLAAGPVATVTLAPELPGALDLIRLLVERGVRASLGHSAATYDVARSAFALGATGCTHLFNAMSGLAHRAPGLAAAALEAQGIDVEVILDGHHVHPAMFRLARRAVRGRLVLVTDAIRACGLPDGPSELGGQPVTLADGRCTLADGTLAGSVLTLDAALRNAVDAGVPLPEAADLLARHPADAIGRDDLGRLEPGARADVVELDADDLSLRRVWRGGVEVDLG